LTALAQTTSRPLTLSDLWFPRRTHALLHDAVLVVAASVAIALLAQVRVPLPGTPVPVTGQTLGVMLSGVVLGRQRGAGAVALYLMLGAVGLPVFTGGEGGIDSFYGVTAGYLFAFPLAAFIVGALAERGKDRKPVSAFFSMLLASLPVLTIGSLVLGLMQGDIAAGFMKGFVPFVVGDIVKAALAAAVLPPLWRWTERSKPTE
jgi:biotin transport system substrate-specific component